MGSSSDRSQNAQTISLKSQQNREIRDPGNQRQKTWKEITMDIELIRMQLKEYRSLVKNNPKDKTIEIRKEIRRLEKKLRK